MKTKISLLLVCLALNFHLFAQNSACDKLFNSYAGLQGFSTINFSGNFLNGIFANGDKDCDFNISSVKILTIEDSVFNQRHNFYKEVLPNLNKEDYEELMTIKNSGQDMVVFCKKHHSKITELILVSGGNNNSLIYVKGSLSLNDANIVSKKLSNQDNL
jgi:hypothetical protein